MRGGLIVAALALAGCRAKVDLPDLGPAPSFALVDQDGEAFTSADLAGRVVVADFIFTRCPHACPMLTARMADVAAATPPEVALVSFSVDPTFDTPAVLKEFAAGYPIPPERWHLLTGELPQIEAVAAGFMQGLARDESTPVPDIKHSQRLLLVDADGRLRGMFETEPEALDALVTAAKGLSR